MLSDLLSGTYLTLSVIAHQFLKTTQTAAPVSLLVLSLSVCRSTARDADTCGEENLSVPAHGLHPIGHPVVSDTTVQTPLRTHQKWQVSSGDTFFFYIYIFFILLYKLGEALCSSRIQRKSSSGTLVWKHDSIYVCQILTGKRFGQGHVWIHWCVFTLWSVKLISNSEGESREVWATQKFIFQEDNF